MYNLTVLNTKLKEWIDSESIYSFLGEWIDRLILFILGGWIDGWMVKWLPLEGTTDTTG